jgi:hypothetical protein
MKLVPVSIEELGEVKRPYSNLYAILMEFENSGHDCMKVENYTQKRSAICANSLRSAVKRYGLNSISIVKRGDNIYLLKK